MVNLASLQHFERVIQIDPFPNIRLSTFLLHDVQILVTKVEQGGISLCGFELDVRRVPYGFEQLAHCRLLDAVPDSDPCAAPCAHAVRIDKDYADSFKGSSNVRRSSCMHS